ncbi:hypothetical protein AB0D46_33840 [Streptomyces sp. NPDC048383]|uniref:hypothetical protein n=1 Tax=Streptomyces sp. NPDC048383 TaxID=3155386 RepID=UPI00342F2A88
MNDAADTTDAADAAASGTTGIRVPSRRTRILVMAFALLLGALSWWVLLPQAQHLRSLRDGVRAEATLSTSGSCVLGYCEVEFEVDGRTVVADLPAGSGGGKSAAGTPLTVRYRADDPQVVAAENDVDGGFPVVSAAMTGGSAVLFLTLSALSTISQARRRRRSTSGKASGAEQ